MKKYRYHFCLSAFVGITLSIQFGFAGGPLLYDHAAHRSESPWETQENPQVDLNIKALADEDATVRQHAAISLVNIGNAQAVEPLIKALDDPDYFVRNFAARALGGIGDRRAVEPLIKSLDDDNILVRRSAAEALGSIGDSRAVEALLNALNDKGYLNELFRRRVAKALGDIRDPVAIEPLISALGDEDSYIRSGAALALVEIGEAAVPRLVNALCDWTAGPQLAYILENLNWQPEKEEDRVRFNVARRNKEALLENWEVTKKVLLADAGSKDARQIENAVYALIGIGQPEVLEELVRIMGASGTVEMAQVFFNCGNEYLSDAAQSWALEHGDTIESEAGSSVIGWGGMQPS